MSSHVLPLQHDWQKQFQSSSFRLGFRLILTNPMMEFLCACAEGVQWNRAFFGNILVPENWMATENALTTRGLIRRMTLEEIEKRPHTEPGARLLSYCTLTPVGRCMVELLKVGGLFIEATEAKRRMANRKGHN